jgi:hypothetical protein
MDMNNSKSKVDLYPKDMYIYFEIDAILGYAFMHIYN